ncbi:MAG: sulfatase-like hydrolase/transferase [Planctomycetes bacterium]|nr:sulfatase-like hydrolase/transferase [Planctomycetota bacterium]
MDRRTFLRTVAAGAAAAFPWARARAGEAAGSGADPRPNILWVSCEDLSPDLGCYGDRYAVTPNLDRLAAQGVRYTNCFTHAGVCAPARSGIITAMYPTTIGTHHMRCDGVRPPEVKCFPEYLRAAGYYCTNNSKTDYQFSPPREAWDESSRKAHWKNRRPGQPFFAVFNLTISHESQIRNRSKGMLARIAKLGPARHDPAGAVLPPYYPDTPAVRQDWAQYYDIMTMMDGEAGGVLKELEDAGLAEDTIVLFWGDHGRGLPRAKRWLYDSGSHAPLIARVPGKFRRLAAPANPSAVAPGTVNDDLIAFLDFGPTVLSLAGVTVPSHMQGRPFLGPQKGAPRQYVFGARDRMDERYDLIRTVRDKRYKYIRNYMAHVPYAQDIEYMNQMPTMQQWRRLAAEGKLDGPQAIFFRPTKPLEELYDTREDPHEIRNLAGLPEYREVLERMRKVHGAWMVETGDVGFIPEAEFDLLKKRGPSWRADLDGTDLLARLRAMKALDGKGEEAIPKYVQALADPDGAVRYWAVVGIHVATRSDRAREEAKAILAKHLQDPSTVVRVAAAHALCDWGETERALPVLVRALSEDPIGSARLAAAIALDAIGEKARPALDAIRASTKDRFGYVARVSEHTLRRLGADASPSITPRG